MDYHLSKIGSELAQILDTEDYGWLSENEFVLFERVKDYIICIYKDFPIVNLPTAKRIAAARKEAMAKMGQEKVFIFVDMTTVKKSTPEARDFYDLPEETAGIHSVALYTESLLAFVVGSFYFKMSKFKGLSQQVFMNKKKALDWLEKSKLKQDALRIAS